MSLELPERVEEKHKGIKIGLRRESSSDGASIVAYVELRYRGKVIEVSDDWSYGPGMSANGVIRYLNGKLAAYGLVLDHRKFESIVARQLEKFYPQKSS